MKILWVWLMLACGVCGALPAPPWGREARAQGAWPECGTRACVAGRPDWPSRNYVVNGKLLSVSKIGDAVRWHCGRGVDPAGDDAPHFSQPYAAQKVELVDCAISPEASYATLLKTLLSNHYFQNLTLSLSSTRPLHARWPSTDEMKQIKIHNINNPKFIERQAAQNGLQHLSLRGIPMTGSRLASVQAVETLTLVRTGLESIMDLSYFKNLHRLEVREPQLADAARLASAPALRELLLQAPDAGLASMPLLRKATFLDVYMMGSIFGNCDNLEELELKRGDLDVMRERWLGGCRKLRKLRLTLLPRLRALPRGLLADAVALNTLDLSANGLETLPDDLLARTTNLTQLDLSHNALTALPVGLLDGAPALDFVNFSHNLLLALPSRLLAGAPTLTSLDLSHNTRLNPPEGFLNSTRSLTHVFLCDIYPHATVEESSMLTVERDNCPN